MEHKTFYRGNLPHLDLPGARFFVTFCTSNGRKLPEWQRGIILKIFQECELINLHQACVMEDHVHLIFNILKISTALQTVCKVLKGRSTREVNLLTRETGVSLWQKESYDRVIRTDEEYIEIYNYIAWNAVTANLCSDPHEYPYYWSSIGVD